MKAGWKTVKLSDVCDIVKGRKPNLRPTPNKGDLPYLVARYIRGLEEPEYGSPTEKGVVTLTEDDTVIICDGSNSGEIFTGLNGIMSSTMGKVVKKTEIHDPYLRHFLASTFELFNGTKTGSAIPHLDKEAFRKLEIPLPPLSEQKRIVALLDEAFAGIDEAKVKAEESIKRSADLFKSLLQSSFASQDPEWAEMTLENCCEQIFAGGDVPKDRLSDERTKEFNVPIYANGEKDAGLYGFTDIARVTKPSITVSARGTLGFTAIRTEPFFPIVRLIVLVPDEKKISLLFLYYAIKGMDFGNTGTSIPQLTVPNFKESKLRVPGLQTQKIVAGKISTIWGEGEALRKLHEQKISMLSEMKNSLLAQAFSGELNA